MRAGWCFPGNVGEIKGGGRGRQPKFRYESRDRAHERNTAAGFETDLRLP
jgi:hypothetical protein